jgi:SanA protein
MAKARRWKWIGGIAFALAAGAALFGFATNRTVLHSAEGKVFTDPATIPAQQVGLVLGTSPTFKGMPNLFFVRRMDAAAELYHAGKVQKLLVSGDNGSVNYDEPTAMRNALVARGVPAEDIVRDYAGFRTLDSVVRAREIFGVSRCTIITDDFHLPRALYIAEVKNVEAVGFQTEPLPRQASPRTYVRELGARALIWIDLHVVNRQPKFLGRPEPIEVAQDGSEAPPRQRV